MEAFLKHVVMTILRASVTAYSVLDNCCARRGSTYRSVVWEAINLSAGTSTAAGEYHELDRYNTDVLLHHVKKIHGLHEFVKLVVIWSDDTSGYYLHNIFDAPPAPWFFIGYTDGEETIDCTDTMEQLIVRGNRITIPLLTYLEPESANKTWVYINPQSFDQVEFPLDGILIGVDVDDTAADDETPPPPPSPTNATKDD